MTSQTKCPVAAAQGFAVDGDQSADQFETDAGDKRGEAFGEDDRINGGENAQEGVGAGYAVG